MEDGAGWEYGVAGNETVHWTSIANPGATFTVEIEPSASVVARVPYPGNLACYVNVSVKVFDLSIVLTGVKGPTNTPSVLVGQAVGASLSNFPTELLYEEVGLLWSATPEAQPFGEYVGNDQTATLTAFENDTFDTWIRFRNSASNVKISLYLIVPSINIEVRLETPEIRTVKPLATIPAGFTPPYPRIGQFYLFDDANVTTTTTPTQFRLVKPSDQAGLTAIHQVSISVVDQQLHDPNGESRWYFTQLIAPDSCYKDLVAGGRDDASGPLGLDGPMRYGVNRPTYLCNGLEIGEHRDSPGWLNVNNALKLHYESVFYTYLMYEAPGDSNPVPIYRFKWTVKGHAVRTSATSPWSITINNCVLTNDKTPQHPTWSIHY